MKIDTNTITFPTESTGEATGKATGEVTQSINPGVDYESIVFDEQQPKPTSFKSFAPSFNPVEIAGRVGARIGKAHTEQAIQHIQWRPLKESSDKERDIQFMSDYTGLDKTDIGNHYQTLKFLTDLAQKGPAYAGVELGKKVDPITTEGVLEAVMTPVIVAAALANPVGTAAGLALFTALDMLVPTDQFIPKDEEGNVKDESQAASIRVLGMIVKGAVVGGVHKKMTAAQNKYHATKILSRYGLEKLKENKMQAEITLKAEQLEAIRLKDSEIINAAKDKRSVKQGKAARNEVNDIKRKLYNNDEIGQRNPALLRQSREEVVAEINALEAKNGKIRNKHQQIRHDVQKQLIQDNPVLNRLGLTPEKIETALNNKMDIKIPAEKLIEVGLEKKSDLKIIQQVLAPEKKVEVVKGEVLQGEVLQGEMVTGEGVVGIKGVVEKPILRPKTENAKTSGLAESIEAKAIEKGIIEKGAARLAEYEGVKLKEQAKMGADLVNTGMDNLRATIRGEEPLPKGMTNFSAILAAEAQLAKKPNADLAYDLANSPLVTAVSEAASELSSGQYRVQDSATLRLQKIKKARIDKAEGLTKETTQTIRKKLKVEVEKNNLSKVEQNWDKFLDEIKC